MHLRAAYQQWDEGGTGLAIDLDVPLESETTNVDEAPAAEPEPTAASQFDEEIMGLFREESQEHVSSLETLLLDLEVTDDVSQRRGIIDNVFRHAHSLKGSARVIGLNELQDRAQVLEDTLDAFRNDPENLAQSSVEKALAEFDAVRKEYDRWEGDGDQPAGDSETNDATHKSVKPSAQDAAKSKPIRRRQNV